MKYLLIPLLALSLIKVDFMTVPAYGWDESLVAYDSRENSYTYTPSWENWMAYSNAEERSKMLTPVKIPAKKKMNFSFRQEIFTDDKRQLAASMFPVGFMKKDQRRRFVLINVEETILDKTKESDRQYRVWPHLGLLFVGTAAHEENWDVVLWDELVQGHVDLETLIQPGDIVCFILVKRKRERKRPDAMSGVRLV